ncbi:alpha-N-acetylgalactosaminide alpha-2,6-sialyltransferase 1-like [Asterias rubens]|uniref:alpha-N-acetylgalactosaminide alpha-2,6-sialyltransferase 1-like n=1 Tax=Asterias rubens TaxID=7604 RepID=UPI00145553B5|nr:alpha-N-acetylgalactosaminide alpha-2,6-sialyltransferase 1-like [Asterias rubens]
MASLFRLRRLYLALAVLSIYGGIMLVLKVLKTSNGGEVLTSLLHQSKLEVGHSDRSQQAFKLGIINNTAIHLNNVIGLQEDQKSKKEVVIEKEAKLKRQPEETEAKLKREQEELRVRELERMPFVRDPAYKQSVCPKTVSSVTKYSKWFRERFIPGIKVFIDKEDLRRVDELKVYDLPFGIRQSDQAFVEILNHTSFRNPELPLHGSSQECIKCAVVGCGGILNGSEAGTEIEGHDYVFRLNRAISGEHYVKDVGKKTTFYTFFPESEHTFDVKDENVTSLYTMFKSFDVAYALHMVKDIDPPLAVRGDKQTYTMRKPNVNRSKLKIIHPSFFRYVYTKYMDGVSYRPTTGAIVVIMALHLCDEVNIYGFGYDKRFTLHYYDDKFIMHMNNLTTLHDVDKERILWKKLHEEGILRLFKRDE